MEKIFVGGLSSIMIDLIIDWEIATWLYIVRSDRVVPLSRQTTLYPSQSNRHRASGWVAPRLAPLRLIFSVILDRTISDQIDQRILTQSAWLDYLRHDPYKYPPHTTKKNNANLICILKRDPNELSRQPCPI